MNLKFPFLISVLVLSFSKESIEQKKYDKISKCEKDCLSDAKCMKKCITDYKQKGSEFGTNSRTPQNANSSKIIKPKKLKVSKLSADKKKNSEENDEDVFLEAAPLPNPDDFNLPNCGITRKKGGLIVGGEKAAAAEFPWIVSFQRPKSDDQLNHFCGGAVLNERWILSAAHCFQGVSHSLKKLKVVVGSIKWKSREAFKYDIEKIICHEHFDAEVYANDICLLRTTEPIIMKETRTHYIVNGVCVPSNETVPTSKAIVAGWGYLSEEGEASEDLMKVIVDKFNYGMCNTAYVEFVGSLTLQMVCYASPGKDACKGDSGGPLIQTINRRGTQIGIVSFGHGCARPGTPGVYQDVAKYYYWIDKTIKNDEKNARFYSVKDEKPQPL